MGQTKKPTRNVDYSQLVIEALRAYHLVLSDCLFCQNNNGANEEAYQKRGLRSIGDTSGECQEYYAVLDGNKRDVDLLGGGCRLLYTRKYGGW